MCAVRAQLCDVLKCALVQTSGFEWRHKPNERSNNELRTVFGGVVCGQCCLDIGTALRMPDDGMPLPGRPCANGQCQTDSYDESSHHRSFQTGFVSITPSIGEINNSVFVKRLFLFIDHFFCRSLSKCVA